MCCVLKRILSLSFPNIPKKSLITKQILRKVTYGVKMSWKEIPFSDANSESPAWHREADSHVTMTAKRQMEDLINKLNGRKLW